VKIARMGAYHAKAKLITTVGLVVRELSRGFFLLLSKTFNLEVSLTALGQGGTIWRDT